MKVIAQLGKKWMFGLFIVFLVGLVIGGIGIDAINREVDLNSTHETWLSTKGVNTWSYEDYETADQMKRCLISPNNYNLPCSNWIDLYWKNCTLHNVTFEVWNTTDYIENESCNPVIDKCPKIENVSFFNETRVRDCLTWERINHTSEEKANMLNSWEEERIKGIAGAIQKRNESKTESLVNEGNVTIKK